MTTSQPPHGAFGRRRDFAKVTIVGPRGTRSLTISPGVGIAAAATAGLTAVAVLASGLYLGFRDDVLGAAMGRQGGVERAYETRIAALRSQLDRLSSRQLVDQTTIEAKIDRLLARQDALREAESRVFNILEKARREGIDLPAGALPTEPNAPTQAPSLLPLRSSSLAAPTAKSGSRAQAVASIESELAMMELRQSFATRTIGALAERGRQRIESVVARLGMRLRADEAQETASILPLPREKPSDSVAAAGPGLGGPLVGVGDESLLGRAEGAVDRLAAMRRAAAGLPLGTPIRGEVSISSDYGPRADPFLGVPAMHTGVDFRADSGDPVLATGQGTVVDSGFQGGYGLMVEVDHGNGLATRYGHLSAVTVVPGQKVRPGDMVGRVGSTGRSTGPHLHYEARVNGEAIDPERWLAAGAELRLATR